VSSLQVELITIGDELLLGFTIDTNAAHIARTLAASGVEIVRRTTVGDEAGKIAQAVREALERTGAVITTGGLGPTSDDLTKPAIAKLFGREAVSRRRIGPRPRFRKAHAYLPTATAPRPASGSKTRRAAGSQ